MNSHVRAPNKTPLYGDSSKSHSCLNAAYFWHRANSELAAKIIAESDYEECLTAKTEGSDPESGTTEYSLVLKSGVHYRFRATRSVWGFLLIEAHSILRNGDALEGATQLVIDAQAELGMSDIILGRFVEEMNNTLFSEAQRLKRLAGFNAKQMTALPNHQLQSLLSGHPKALANKGRMGWGTNELEQYSPESGNSFQLRYLAVSNALLSTGMHPSLSKLDLIKHSLNAFQINHLEDVLQRRKLHLQDYWVIPVHPWQWQAFIQIQYAQDIALGNIVDLGVHGDFYCAQQSIRTLSNVTRPSKFDIKLPLTILNTSCYRGIPGKHIASGAALSGWLAGVVENDALLNRSNLIVQQEKAGVHADHSIQAQLPETPYRYNEMLGVVWRDSLESFIEPRAHSISQVASDQERGILMATLMEKDIHDTPLIVEYIKQSGLTTEAWLGTLFDTVVVPLYHLLACYGVGVIAHGQNISLILRNGIPHRASIKDFHGDLRIIDQDFPQLDAMPDNVKSALTRLPAEHLIHDLVTGHFVTTLRFISPLLSQPNVPDNIKLSEHQFYTILRSRIESYMANHSSLSERFKLFPLFNKTILKICINRVRFRIGYNDDAQRPIPELGTPLTNPLAMHPFMEEQK